MNAPCNSPEIVEITLLPGQFYFGEKYTRIHTILGSCVAITLWHPTRCIGGMCHYLLPSRGGSRHLTQGYYAEEVVNMFMDELHKADTKAGEYEAKVFGGADMFENYGKDSQRIAVPKNNIEMAMRLLKLNGFTLKARDVGGSFHRKIFLELWNGDVWVQHGTRLKPGARL